MRYAIVFLAIFLTGCAAPGYNKSVDVTVLGTHHIYEVPADSEIKYPDGDKKKVKESSVLISDYYFKKILRARVNFKDKEDEESIPFGRINQ